MFDFSFSEVALIGVVALVVIGPERLPRVARTAGVMVNRAQRYAASVRADIEREVELSEMRRVQSDLQGAAQAFQADVRQSLASAEAEFEQNRQAVMQGPAPAQLSEPQGEGTAWPVSKSAEPAPAALPAEPPAAALPAAALPAVALPAAARPAAAVHEPAYAAAPGDPAPPPADPATISLMGWHRMLGPAAAARGPRSGAGTAA